MSTETYKIQNSQLESPGGGGGDDFTTADISYYADGTDGDDGYDGLTVSTPKKTLQAVFNLIPYHVRNLVDVNLVGIFADDYGILSKRVSDGYYIAIDGGDAVTSVTGPYTATGTANASINATSITNYIYCGYWVKMTSGKNNGYIRGIRYVSGNAASFQKQDMGDNEVGDTFDIVKPATKLTSASSIKLACSGPGSVVVQRMHLDGGTKIWSEACGAAIVISALTADDSVSGPAYSFENCREVEFGGSLYSGGTFSNIINAAGVSAVGPHDNTMVVLTNVNDVSMSTVFLSNLEFNNCGVGLINRGSIFCNKVTFTNSKSIGGDIYEPHTFENTNGYIAHYFRNWYSGVVDEIEGMFIINSSIGIKWLYVADSFIHGIELTNSVLRVPIGGDINGTGNDDFGVYAHSGSTVLISEEAQSLSITGNEGEFSTDGSTEESTWADIQGGTPIADTATLVLAKEVPSYVDSFQVLDTINELPSIANLDPNITINSLTVRPTFVYKGEDATVTEWPAWEYGSTLPIGGSGDLPLVNQGSPLLGLIDDSVKIDEGKAYITTDDSLYDVTTEDVVFETIVRYGGTGPSYYYAKKENASTGINVVQFTSNNVYFQFYGAGANVAVYSADDAFVVGAWYHIMCFADKSGSAQVYVNGVASGSAANISSVGSLTSDGYAAIGVWSDGTSNPTDANLAYLAMWKKDAWLNSHIQTALAAERFYKVVGIWPQLALGTSAPTVCTRASVAYLENNGTSYLVGAGWPRVEHITDINSDAFKGYHSEMEVDNIAKASEQLQSWTTKLRVTIESNNTDQPTPFEGTYFDGMIGNTDNNTHFISVATSENLTAAKWCGSFFAKKGDVDWVHAQFANVTAGHPEAYWDLANGVVGTETNCTAGMIDYDNGIYRCWWTSTANCDNNASNINFWPAEADGDSIFAGDNVTVNIWAFGFQMEEGVYPTSYTGITTTTTVTREADSLYYKGNNGNVSDQKGTIISDFLHRDYAPGAISNIVTLSDGGSANDVINTRIDTSQNLELYVRAASSETVNVSGSTDICVNDGYNMKVWYETDSFLSLMNGAPETAKDTSCAIPNDLDRIHIGEDEGSINQLNGWIRNVRLKSNPTTR